MQFIEKTLIEGLEVHHYLAKFTVDQHKEPSFLPIVPETRAVLLDVSLDLFIEPVTGYLVKYNDQALGNYYDKATDTKLHLWNKFSNIYTFGSIIKHVSAAKQMVFFWRVFHSILPIAMLLLFLALIISSWYKKNASIDSGYSRIL
jgi:hypothetical protein